MEQTIHSLSIADLKAAIEFVRENKREKIDDLKSQGLDLVNDLELNTLNQIEFDLNNVLFKRVIKFKRN